ncbi:MULTISPECIES: RHS repeat-associated core domain-containing protein [unclassified Pseudomonas]|uniref:RHS repeat-associated core domain-containing protein n=1 Tax=unclassified Pseudomonas TaxID=196821 RepID=UPI002114292C|nr:MULTISPECIES: RHS repeat-associated core domain-containing protein [unclassified Pseudomonas]WEZ88567.1 RHS repeat-associated core domain-containing protein [Pseudomonas sp. NyZ480]
MSTKKIYPGGLLLGVNYSPYGNHPALVSMLGFNAERPDPVTGYYFLGRGYRAYASALMRFVKPDDMSPFGAGGLNSYAYCFNDPINLQDPDGHTPTIKSGLQRGVRFISNLFTKRVNGQRRKLPQGIGSVEKTIADTRASHNKANGKSNIANDYVLIGFHGTSHPDAHKLKSGLNERYVRHGNVHGVGFYTSPYKEVARGFAGSNGGIYAVYASNFKKWVHGVDFVHVDQGELLIKAVAYKNVIVRREIIGPLVLSDTFKEYMVTPPNSDWLNPNLPASLDLFQLS